jgi:hypothetical protein
LIYFLNIFKITIACGKVIEAKNEKNKASKITRSFAAKYNNVIPHNDTNQYQNAVFK